MSICIDDWLQGMIDYKTPFGTPAEVSELLAKRLTWAKNRLKDRHGRSKYQPHQGGGQYIANA